jgi:hypothetical protein
MKKVVLPQQKGWEYLEKIDRKEYQDMTFSRKIRIVADLFDFVRHLPKNGDTKKWDDEKIKAYQHIQRVIKNASS